VDLVLLSHNHYDHLDRPTLAALAAAHRPTVVTLRGNERYLGAAPHGRVKALDWWESIEVGGTRVTATPAQHFSGRGLFDRDRALWGGFVLEWDGPTVFFASDTGYWSHFREIHDHFSRPGLALLPIGAYEPRWFMAPAHMNPSDAVRAHVDLGAPPTLGMHFGTFRLTDEAWDDPPRALDAALDEAGVDRRGFRAPRPGETFLVNSRGFVEAHR
jgi:L-ascorbate metabolism protein UlaG (beta-lactamase superfamily)